MVYILLGEGFEEVEALTPCDLLRRAGIEVRLAGIGGLNVTGGHRITVRADCTAEEVQLSDMEMLVLPGGLKGVESIRHSECAMSLIRQAWEKGRFVTAICAAPTILAELGITAGRRAVCYPGMEDRMGSAIMQNMAPAVTDGRVITGRSAGSAMRFALTLIEQLRGRETAEKTAQGVYYLGE